MIGSTKWEEFIFEVEEVLAGVSDLSSDVVKAGLVNACYKIYMNFDLKGTRLIVFAKKIENIKKLYQYPDNELLELQCRHNGHVFEIVDGKLETLYQPIKSYVRCGKLDVSKLPKAKVERIEKIPPGLRIGIYKWGDKWIPCNGTSCDISDAHLGEDLVGDLVNRLMEPYEDAPDWLTVSLHHPAVFPFGPKEPQLWSLTPESGSVPNPDQTSTKNYKRLTSDNYLSDPEYLEKGTVNLGFTIHFEGPYPSLRVVSVLLNQISKFCQPAVDKTFEEDIVWTVLKNQSNRLTKYCPSRKEEVKKLEDLLENIPKILADPSIAPPKHVELANYYLTELENPDAIILGAKNTRHFGQVLKAFYG